MEEYVGGHTRTVAERRFRVNVRVCPSFGFRALGNVGDEGQRSGKKLSLAQAGHRRQAKRGASSPGGSVGKALSSGWK